MERNEIIKCQRNKLNSRYKYLIEEAYNLKETDHELSDISEYKAIKLLGELKKIDYFLMEETQA